MATTHQSGQVPSRVPCTKLALGGNWADWYREAGGKFIVKPTVNQVNRKCLKKWRSVNRHLPCYAIYIII